MTTQYSVQWRYLRLRSLVQMMLMWLLMSLSALMKSLTAGRWRPCPLHRLFSSHSNTIHCISLWAVSSTTYLSIIIIIYLPKVSSNKATLQGDNRARQWGNIRVALITAQSIKTNLYSAMCHKRISCMSNRLCSPLIMLVLILTSVVQYSCTVTSIKVSHVRCMDSDTD